MMKAKKKLTKLWSILLTLVMVVGMLPATALAEGSTPATADFTDVTEENLATMLGLLGGEDKATWDGSTLTLKGVNFTTTAATAVKLPDGATIVLADGTTNSITGGDSESAYCYGIQVDGNLTISGSGTLNVTAGNASSRSCGIYAGSNTDKALTISSGTVIATGGDVSSGPSFGIYTLGYFTISGTADVTGKGGTATGDGSFGISAEKQVNISGGTVKAIGGTGIGSDGLYSGNGDIQISGGKVEAIGGDAPKAGGSAGIFAQTSSANVTISGNADVTARGGKSASDRSYGIYSANKVTISGGKVEATADDGRYSSYGINNTAYIYGGTITAASADGDAIPYVNLKVSDFKTISFDKNGGSGQMKAYTKDGSYTLPANGFTAPAGKQFKGWATSANGEVISNSTIDVAADTTLYAIWKPITITFDANGGKVNGNGTDTATTDTNGKLTSLPTPTRSGYTFKEWNTAANGSGSKVDTAYVFITDTTIYAQWTPVASTTYTIIFDVNGANASVAPASGTTNAAGKLTSLPTPIRSGYTFTGWNTQQNGTGTTVTTDTTFTENTTVYAQWTAATYSVTWKSQDGNSILETDSGVASGTAPSFNSENPTKAQDDQYTYTFAGWATSKNQEGGKVVSSLPKVTDNVTYYAAFSKTARSYSVTLNTNGGTINSGNVTTYTYGTGATLPTPTKTGYTFGGWYASSSFTGDAVTAIASNATGAKTFYAKWNVISTGGGSYTPPTYKVESEVSKDADGSVSFSKSSAKKGDTVTITVTPDRYYKVDSVTVKDKNGKEIAVTDNGDGTFTFKMPDSKVAVEPVFSWDNPFGDVAETAYYAPAVEWALKNDVTGGTTTATFSPNTGCTRAQIVTFLWRAAGCPEPAGANSFTDVFADAYYAKAVAWAAEQGITGGTGDGKFSPDAVCTRSQSMTFIYRSEQAQGGGMQGEWMFLNPFADVNLEDYYGEAVMWAVANGVTDGTSDTTFSPNATCTRGQIVTFLYRFFVK